MSKTKEQEKPVKGPAGGKKTSPTAPYPTNPPPAAVQEQIQRGGPPADHPSRQPVPESRTPESDNERLLAAERERMEDAEKARQEQNQG